MLLPFYISGSEGPELTRQARKMGTGRRIPCLLLLLAIGLFFCPGSSSSDHGNPRLPNAVVVGTVYCDTCFQQEFSRTSHFISGGFRSACFSW